MVSYTDDDVGTLEAVEDISRRVQDQKDANNASLCRHCGAPTVALRAFSPESCLLCGATGKSKMQVYMTF